MEKNFQKSVSIFTLGCKVNQYESDVLTAKLKSLGYDASSGLKPADIFIFNTCAVTGEAERKSRQLVARAKKLNPDAKIIILGCAPELNSAQFDLPGVIAVRGNANKFDIEKYIGGAEEKYRPDFGAFENADEIAVSRVRQTVKIQDGCDRFCSYCIIPYLRGRSRSRDITDIKKEIGGAAPEVKEIVLTGIDLSDYGKDKGGSLSALINELSDLPLRLRLGSLEVSAVDEKLLSALKNCRNFCPHFHISLQSGSGEVLKKMNRRYAAEDFSAAVNRIREIFPDASVTADVIVGFPSETEENFRETVSLVEKTVLADLHVFPYSRRAGTAAAKLPQVAEGIKKERARILTEVKESLKAAFLERQSGVTANVLTETVEAGYLNGYSENYVKVYIPASCGRSENEIVKVKLSERIFDGMLGAPDED